MPSASPCLGAFSPPSTARRFEPATEGLPESAAHTAGDSLGGAVVAAQHVGGQAGAALLDAARTAWIHGFGVALTVAAAVAAAGATVAAIWLPARSADTDQAAADDHDGDLDLVAA